MWNCPDCKEGPMSSVHDSVFCPNCNMHFDVPHEKCQRCVNSPFECFLTVGDGGWCKGFQIGDSITVYKKGDTNVD